MEPRGALTDLCAEHGLPDPRGALECLAKGREGCLTEAEIEALAQHLSGAAELHATVLGFLELSGGPSVSVRAPLFFGVASYTYSWAVFRAPGVGLARLAFAGRFGLDFCFCWLKYEFLYYYLRLRFGG